MITLYTLTLCFGTWMSICGMTAVQDFPDRDSCERERVRLERAGGYAMCAPRIVKP